MRTQTFKQGQKLITEREVSIGVYEINGLPAHEIVTYPKGEVFEIVECLENNEYELKFWLDSNATDNGKEVTYTFDAEEISEWLTKNEREKIS